MIESEREKLFNRDSEYLSIGITEGGKTRDITHVPWERTAHAFNMKVPSVYLSPEDLSDEEILKKLHGYRVIGCYIYAPLENYDFLKTFPEIRDLYIERAEGLVDISFISTMRDCDMLFLEGARLKNLDALVEAKKAKHGIFGSLRCLGLCDCEIEDVTSLSEVSFSEFIVWSTNEKERYESVSASTKRYYEINNERNDE